MLWDLIYEFYVKYIFGGLLVNNQGTQYYYGRFIFDTFNIEDQTFESGSGFIRIYFPSLTNSDNFSVYMTLGNYFSLIATIITMLIILVVIGHFIKKTFNLFGRII